MLANFSSYLSMKAIAITQPGGPEVLQLVEREIPVATTGEVLIQVKAAGVNRPDVTQRKGHYPAPPGVAADIPGLEIAGIVAKIGSACTRWKKGDSVCALIAGGGYAEYVAVPEGQCLPLPNGVDFSGAASLPETFFTVWTNVFDRAGLRPGESILIQGGAGGIGVAAIQMCKAWGCKVYATAGSPSKAAFCRELGADVAIDYTVQSFHEIVMKETGGRGVDVVLDMIGGSYTPLHLDLLATDGRLSIINFMKGDETTIHHAPILRKRLTITGSTLRARDAAFKSAIASNLERTVWPWLSAGIVKPVVTETFPLAAAADAHRKMESGAHTGKIVLTV
jgi:NADPH2:quinone reductase